MQSTLVPPVRRSRMVDASPVYYGWVILFVGAVGTILTSPGQTYSVSVFIDHFIADLGISRSLVSTLYSVGTLTASFALPFVGRQIDRRGSRLMIVGISLLLGLACVYMGFVYNWLMLGIGFFLLRMLGQGSLSLASRYAINQWWVRRRGSVMGIAGVATAILGSGGFPVLINWLIPQFGWRLSYGLLGVGVMALMIPLALLFVRDKPEQYGLLPDGAKSLSDQTAKNKGFTEVHWTLAEALGTPAFWLVSAAIASMSMLGTGLTFHIFSIFEDSGLSAAMAASVFLPMAATAGVMQLAGGLLIDRVPVRLLLAVALFLQALALVMAPFLTSAEMAYGYGVVMGSLNGLQMIVGSVVWAKYFGRQHLGAITGVVSTIGVASSALGPMPFGIARDLMGSYTTILVAFAVLPFALGVANLFYGKPPVKGERG